MVVSFFFRLFFFLCINEEGTRAISRKCKPKKPTNIKSGGNTFVILEVKKSTFIIRKRGTHVRSRGNANETSE